MALEMGGNSSGSATFIGKQYYFYYFLAACFPAWWAMDIATRVVGYVLRPWQPHLLVVLTLGALLGMVVATTWGPLRQSLFVPYLAEGSEFYSVFPWRFDDPDYLMEALLAFLRGSAMWVGANYLFLKVLKFPRFGAGNIDAPPNEASGDAPEAAIAEPEAAATGQRLLFDQLPENLGRDIVALKAEEHYTRVYTEHGQALVLMRFRDAIALLADLGGVQTHRSFWINPKHVARVEREGRSSTVYLDNDQEVPVSRSYRLLVHEALSDKLA
jgi:hypothetical protein